MCVSVLVMHTHKWQNHSDIHWNTLLQSQLQLWKLNFSSSSLGNNMFLLCLLTYVMFSLVCSLCSVAGGWRNTCKEHKSHFFPLPPSAPSAQWARGWLGHRGQLCLSSFPSLCMCIVTSKEKVSSQSSGTHSQLSWRESNREENQGLPQTDTNTNATLSHRETSIPKHRFPSPNAGRGPLDKWGQAWVSERRI